MFFSLQPVRTNLIKALRNTPDKGAAETSVGGQSGEEKGKAFKGLSLGWDGGEGASHYKYLLRQNAHHYLLKQQKSIFCLMKNCKLFFIKLCDTIYIKQKLKERNGSSEGFRPKYW